MAAVETVYSKAIFELAQEKGQLDKIFQDMKSFLESYRSSADLQAAFGSQAIDLNTRKSIMASLLSSSDFHALSKRFLEMLVARNRMSSFPVIVEGIQALVESSQGIISGEVRSAVELSPEEVSVLSGSLAKRVGRKVRLSQVVDPSLLGGVVATVAGKTFDASLKTQLERFKNELI